MAGFIFGLVNGGLGLGGWVQAQARGFVRQAQMSEPAVPALLVGRRRGCFRAGRRVRRRRSRAAGRLATSQPAAGARARASAAGRGSTVCLSAVGLLHKQCC
jgi:hypothetical protein